MSIAIPSYFGHCPCLACQRHELLTPRQRELRKRQKIIDKFVADMERQGK